MASIVYKSLSSLSPIELKYQYQRDEELEASFKTYKSGLTIYEIEGFKNFQDVTINKNSLLLLTSTVNLSSVFTTSKTNELGILPGSVYLQPRPTIESQNDPLYFLKYKPTTNNFKIFLEVDGRSTFHIAPVNGTREIELFVDNKYVQVDEAYPYTVRLATKTLDPESINRQRFEPIFKNNLITFKTLTNSGYRYLALGRDNVLRATGLMLGDTVINDYVFICKPVTTTQLTQGFTSTNNWVTYFFDVERKTDNKTVNLNKVLAPVQTNLLIDLPIEKAAANGEVNINIANLKTGLTPGGGPAPVNNAYDKQVITSN